MVVFFRGDSLFLAIGKVSVNANPSSPYFPQRYIGYNASKVALNMLTVQLTAELRDAGIVVNSVSPGFVKTDLLRIHDAAGGRPPAGAACGAADSGRFIEPHRYTPW